MSKTDPNDQVRRLLEQRLASGEWVQTDELARLIPDALATKAGNAVSPGMYENYGGPLHYGRGVLFARFLKTMTDEGKCRQRSRGGRDELQWISKSPSSVGSAQPAIPAATEDSPDSRPSTERPQPPSNESNSNGSEEKEPAASAVPTESVTSSAKAVALPPSRSEQSTITPTSFQERPKAMSGIQQPATLPGQVNDALALWEAEVAAAPVGLTEIRLDMNERLLLLFTTTLVRAAVHWVDYPSLKGYFHCNGKDCLLCRIGRQPDTRDLIPVYDPLEKAVGVLAVSPNIRPNALRPQLLPILKQVQAQASSGLVGIRKLDQTKFVVASYPLSAGVDHGAAAVQAFVEKFEAGQIDLSDIYTRLSNDDLAAIPEVASLMTLKGIKHP